MKKFSVVLNVVLVVAVAVLFVLFFTNNSKSAKGEEVTTENGVAQKGDIVYIEIDSLINKYDMFNGIEHTFILNITISLKFATLTTQHER